MTPANKFITSKRSAEKTRPMLRKPGSRLRAQLCNDEELSINSSFSLTEIPELVTWLLVNFIPQDNWTSVLDKAQETLTKEDL